MLRTGDQLGPYTLVRKLGRGAFGFVWLAERRTVIATTHVALKIPIDDEIDLETIKSEVALWISASGHPNVLPLIEANLYDDLIVLVSEYAPDGSLADWLKQNGGSAPTAEVAVEMASGILAGLEHLHSRRIVHRDLKPANILLQGREPRLADFGVSRVLKTTAHSNVVAGTPQYMAPEAFSGLRNEQTDLWSVGIILYQMLRGRLPFPQTDIAALAVSIQNSPLFPLPTVIPEKLRRVVDKALQKEPRLRYASAAEMRTALDAVSASTSGSRYATTPIVNDFSSNPAGSTEIITNQMASPSDPSVETRPAPAMYQTVPATGFDQVRQTPVNVNVAQQPSSSPPMLVSAADRPKAILTYVALSTVGWVLGLGLWVLLTIALNFYYQMGITVLSVFPIMTVTAAQFVALKQFVRVSFLRWFLVICVSIPLTLIFLSPFLLYGYFFPWQNIGLAVSGVVMGVLQWLILRKYITRSGLWIAGTAVAALLLSFLISSLAREWNYQLFSVPRLMRAGINVITVGTMLGVGFGFGQALCLLGFGRKTASDKIN